MHLNLVILNVIFSAKRNKLRGLVRKRIDEFDTEIPKFIGKRFVGGEFARSGDVTVSEVLSGDAFQTRMKCYVTCCCCSLRYVLPQEETHSLEDRCINVKDR